jgi:hypothetical protein
LNKENESAKTEINSVCKKDCDKKISKDDAEKKI